MSRPLRSSVFLCFVLFCSCATVSAGGTDCQDNEYYVLCGQCEGTCANPRPTTCFVGCRDARCECVLASGFVRAHDGMCVKVENCPSYPSAWANEEYYGGYVNRTKTEPPPEALSVAPTAPPVPAPAAALLPTAAPPAGLLPSALATVPPMTSGGLLRGILMPSKISSAHSVAQSAPSPVASYDKRK